MSFYEFMNSINSRSPKSHSAREAHGRNDLGNDAYKRGFLVEAIQYYSDAISMCRTDPKFYCNRAKCYLVQGRCNDALADCKVAAKLDEKYPRVYYREAECYLGLGNYYTAITSLNKLKNLLSTFPGLRQLESKIGDAENLEAKAKEALTDTNYELALQYTKELLETVTSCTRIKTLHIECLLHMGFFKDAEDLSKGIVDDGKDVDIKYVTALFAYYDDDLRKATNICKAILNLAPDCTKTSRLLQKIKKLDNVSIQGKMYYTNMDYRSANQIYSYGLEIEPTNVKVNQRLRLNRAIVRLKLGDYEGSIKDCDEVLQKGNKRGKVYFTKGECYLNLGKKEEALVNFKRSYEIDKLSATKNRIEEIQDPNFNWEPKVVGPNVNNERRTTEATVNEPQTNTSKLKKLSVEQLRSELERMKNAKNHFEMLKLGNNATRKEIDKACNTLYKSFHPDRYNQCCESKALCEEIFKRIKSAKEKIPKDS